MPRAMKLTWLGFSSVPAGFIPQQDKQYLVAFAQLPEAATLDRTDEVLRRMGDIMLEQPGVEHAVAFPGLSINGFVNAPNAGIVFVTLADFAEVMDLVVTGKLKPVLDKTFPLKEAAAAQERLWRGENFGKIILDIA